ncbi:MAG: MTH938/NDUFAF3 family protein [Bacteroidales bacterium]
MKPTIDGISFGAITIAGREYAHDVIILPDGTVEKRNKKLSRMIFGDSHKVSEKEAAHIHREGAELIIIGNGHYGELELSGEAKKYFSEMRCDVEVLNSRKAVARYNQTEHSGVIAMIHVTC